MIFDLHNDFPTVYNYSDYEHYLSANEQAEITAAIWTDELSDACSFVDSTVKKLISLKCAVAIENIGFTAKNDLFETFDFSNLLYCSLTWNGDNAFAGGALGEGRLTPLGRRAITRIEKSGCYVDVAHLNRKSFYDVLDVADRIVCSHTGFNDNARSLTANQINELVSRNKVIGLCAVSSFSGAKSKEDFIAVIDRFVSKYGDDSLAIGTDYNGSADIPNDLCDYDKLFCVIDGLRDMGYSNESLDKIFYRNAKTLTRRV